MTTTGSLTKLDKERIKGYDSLTNELRWRTAHIAKKRAMSLVDDLTFLLEMKQEIGSLSDMVGAEKTELLLKLLAVDLCINQSVLSPSFIISVIEENRVLAEMIAKKNKVWRDLVSQVNSASDMEAFVKKITDKENVYMVDGENVRVHFRK